MGLTTKGVFAIMIKLSASEANDSETILENDTEKVILYKKES